MPFHWLLIAMMATLILAPFVWAAIFALTQVKRGWRVLYASWALVIVVAIALPMIIPYAIWPPTDPRFNRPMSTEEVFQNWARTQVPETRYLPATVSVEAGPLLAAPVGCGGPARLHEVPRKYRATVTVRGPYGVPIERYTVTCAGLDEYRPSAFVLIALLLTGAGVLAVSMPFIAVRRLRLQHAPANRLVGA